LIEKNLKNWEECIPHANFAYNCVKHSTMRRSFEAIYGFESYTALDVLPLLLHEGVNMDDTKNVKYMKKLHKEKRDLQLRNKCYIKL
jgi:hypothetical protein